MKVVDDKGKFFGFINIIDLLLVLFLVAAVYFAVVVVFKKGSVVVFSQDKNIRVKFMVQDITPDVSKFFRKGDVVKRRETQGRIGVINKVKITPAQSIEPNDQGIMIESTKPNRRDVFFEVETKGRQNADIVATGSEILRVGEEYEIVSPAFFAEAMVVGVSVSGK